MPLSPQMQYPWLPRKNYVDPDSMLGLDPRALPRTPGYDPSQVRAGDDTPIPGRKIPAGGGGGVGSGGGIDPPPPPPPPPPARGIPGQSHGTPPLRVPMMHQGTQPPPDYPSMHQHHDPVGDRTAGTSGRAGPDRLDPGMGFGGGGPIEPPAGGGGDLGPVPTMGLGFGGGGPIGGPMGGGGGDVPGGGGPTPGGGPLTVPTMGSSMGGNAGGGISFGQPPVPGNPAIPIPTLPIGIGGGGSTGGPIDNGGKEKNPWSWWGGDDDQGDELMGRGGIVTQPTRVRLGEQGPEAVRKLRPENFEVGERPMTYLRRSGR